MPEYVSLSFCLGVTPDIVCVAYMQPHIIHASRECRFGRTDDSTSAHTQTETNRQTDKDTNTRTHGQKSQRAG